MFVSTALALSPLLIAPPPRSELDLARVPADATWLVHVDLAAFRTTGLWRLLLEQIENGELDIDWDELEAFERRFGFRPLHDVASVTVFGRDEIGEDPVVQVETSAQLDAALAHLQQQPQYRNLQRAGLSLHAWDDGGHVEGAFYVHTERERRVVVFSEDEDELLKAVDVLLGRGQNMRQGTSGHVLARPTPGAFLYVDATAVLSELSGFDAASAVADLARSARIEVGESRGELFLTIQVDAGTLENAQNIYAVVNGAKALAAMAGTQEGVPPFAMDLLNAIEMDVRGELVSLRLRYETRELVEQLRELEEWDH